MKWTYSVIVKSLGNIDKPLSLPLDNTKNRQVTASAAMTHLGQKMHLK